MSQQDDRESEWHLDKRVPLALIATLVISMLGNVWWISALGSRVDFAERAIASNALVREDIVKITEQLRSLDRIVGRIENYLDRRDALRKGREDGTLTGEQK